MMEKLKEVSRVIFVERRGARGRRLGSRICDLSVSIINPRLFRFPSLEKEQLANLVSEDQRSATGSRDRWSSVDEREVCTRTGACRRSCELRLDGGSRGPVIG